MKTGEEKMLSYGSKGEPQKGMSREAGPVGQSFRKWGCESSTRNQWAPQPGWPLESTSEVWALLCSSK